LRLLQQLLIVAGVAFLIQALISAIAPDLQIPLRVMALGSLLSTAGIFAGRLLFGAYVLPRVAGERLLLVGNSPLLDDLTSHLALNPQSGIQVAGHIGKRGFKESGLAEAGAETASLEEAVEALNPSRIVVGFDGGLSSRLAHELLQLRFSGRAIEHAAGTYETICNREGLSGLNAARLLYSKEFEPGTRPLFFQAIGNFLTAAALLTLLSPVSALIAAWLWLSSREGVFERQRSVGRKGPFTLYRFRVGENRIGRLLTRTGLYALPEFAHVVRGQMSIVGPRPERPEFERQLSQRIPFYAHRLNVRPGITAWSHIHMWHMPGPRDSMMELEYDLYYIKNFSLMLDILVIAQALKILLLWGGQP
jgi:lipopolysaccharide/colanic/teichoic acid biosynthesis glycosyltransferase